MAEGKPEAIIDRRRSINISCKNSIDFDNNVKKNLPSRFPLCKSVAIEE